MLYPATKLRPLAIPGLATSTIKVRSAPSLGNGVATADSCFSSFRGLVVGFWAAATAPFPRALAHRCCGGPQGEQPACSGWRCPEQSGRRWRAAPRRARSERTGKERHRTNPAGPPWTTAPEIRVCGGGRRIFASPLSSHPK
jgi:hypothetical protein